MEKLVSTWEMMSKNNEGVPEVTQLHKYEYPSEFDEAKLLTQAAPTIISSEKVTPRRSKTLLLADIPDIHYGLRRLPDGTLQPTHRPEVLDGFLQVMKNEQPNIIIIGGDAIDAPEIGKYDPDSKHFVDTIQLSIDGLYRYFSRLRADNPNADIIHLKGNHEQRFTKNIIRNSMPLLGVRQADLPDSWAVNSYPHLLRLEDLEIKWVDQYQINDRLMTKHGELSNKSSTAAMYLGRYATSIMYHHDHRRGYERRVFPNGTAIEAFGFGCQADTSGAVPSVHNKIDDKGFIVENFENWNSGGGFVEFSKGDKPFRHYAVPIEPQDNYETKYNGKLFKARQEVIDALKSGN